MMVITMMKQLTNNESTNRMSYSFKKLYFSLLFEFSYFKFLKIYAQLAVEIQNASNLSPEKLVRFINMRLNPDETEI